MTFLFKSAILPLLAWSLGTAVAAQAAPPDSPVVITKNPQMTLSVDATDSARHLLHVQMDLPVSSGPLTLMYPKWLPGEHAPNGPVANVANLVFTSGDRALSWQRDPVDLYAFHLVVPGGARSLHAAFDLLVPADPTESVTSENVDSIVWTSLVLYPQGRTADNINVAASLRLPEGWKYGTALPVAGMTGDIVRFQPAPLVTLLDSPVIAGSYTKTIPLTLPGDPAPVEIDMVADTPDGLEIPDNQVQSYKKLIVEANSLWGAHHYREYHFLYTLSDQVHKEGLEHHESSQDSEGADLFTDEPRRGSDDLFAHEYTHSWNGKYRRPYDLYTPDYQKPMQDDLLWVYEGLTQYYGEVLTARSGLWTPEDYRDNLADTAADLDGEAGRAWRPLLDTATSSPLLYGARGGWSSIRRSVDYYSEMTLVWLEADTIIRQQTGGKKSLDDFARAFAGGPSSPPQVKTYTFDDIVKLLNGVAPYDWKAFLTARVYTIALRAPLGGIVSSGWKLIFNGTQSEIEKSSEKRHESVRLTFSLGIVVNKDAQVGDVIPALPAGQAGLAPGMKIIAVNGRAYSQDGLKSAVKDSKASTLPIEMLVQNGDTFKTLKIDYHGGARYPHLERDTSRPDTLSLITAPFTAALHP